MSYTPSPWGAKFHALTHHQALGGGAAGGGKSVVLLHDADYQIQLQHARCARGEFPWGRAPGAALHIRKEYTRLDETMNRARQVFPLMDPEVKWESDAMQWRFSSGYRYRFGHLSKPDSHLNYLSAEFTKLLIDEAGEIENEDQFHYLDGRVRTDDPVLAPLANTRLMSNPCAGWLRDYFVEPWRPGGRPLLKEVKLESGEVVQRTRIYLPARLSDNPSALFRREYEIRLRDKPSHIRAAWLDGDWYVIAGAYFAEEWDPQRVVIKPFALDPHLRRFRTLDWGFKDTCVCLWWCVLPDGELVCYRERTWNKPSAKRRLDARQVAIAIKDIEMANGEWSRMRNRSRLTGWADTQLWTDLGAAGGQSRYRGHTMAHDMAAEGVTWGKAIKGRVQAAQQMVKRLNWVGYAGRPAIMFFENCQYSITTIPAIGTDENEPEAPAETGPVHAWDATMYALNANPLPDNTNAYYVDTDDDPIHRDEVRQTEYRGTYGYGGH